MVSAIWQMIWGAGNVKMRQDRNCLAPMITFREKDPPSMGHRGSQLPINAFHTLLLRWLYVNQISDLLKPAFFGYMPFEMPYRNRKFGK
jgi:hypothetical protein